MTAPRQILPGTTYLVTRRCSQRQFLLKPSETTNAIFRFVLAVAARRFGVRLHAFCVLFHSDFHLVLTDPDACLPAFEQYMDSLIARAVNASLGRRAYREAWLALKAGARDVLFPAGSYWPRVALGIPCAAFG